MSTDIDIHEQYINISLPADIPDNLNEFLPEDEDLTYEEVILQQASVYHSYQESGTTRVVTVEEDHRSDSDIDIHEQYINISLPADIPDNLNEFLPEDEDLTYEEVILQQASVYHSYQESGTTRVVTVEDDHRSDSSCTAESSDSGQDDIDPDNMRYEELLDLTESVGVENVGLSALHISQLPTSIYRSGMLSNNNEEK
ncbi:Zinc finger, RING/FYVE/PHD-type [Artemisia annua]|uniref:Zinc finger, RING/FYVE/PHD-type n=1 Tax=Artemisia annua TaxID=35608 RepID=A0A2U1QK54_ARTAN|nr:Zinc finger, RING/FYVE/PHD-type [Artemisia annua]